MSLSRRAFRFFSYHIDPSSGRNLLKHFIAFVPLKIRHGIFRRILVRLLTLHPALLLFLRAHLHPCLLSGLFGFIESGLIFLLDDMKYHILLFAFSRVVEAVELIAFTLSRPRAQAITFLTPVVALGQPFRQKSKVFGHADSPQEID
jgi:uncharacterized membrane protein YGL010W